jgi:outer membrane protein assembly factor BamB
MVVLALALPGTSRQALATDWCSGGVCQEWVARYNGPGSGYDEAHALAVDGSGNVYVTGESWGVGTNRDYATVKYDGATGDQLWEKRYNGPADNDDVALDVAVDGSGNVYVTGQSVGSGTGSDYATVKYDGATGDQLWEKRYNGPASGWDAAVAVAVDGLGNVYVTGYSAGSGTGYDYATVKYDGATGDQLWEKRYNNSPVNGTDGAAAVALDGSGNVYVTGYSTGSGTGLDYATVKYDGATGDQLWAKRYNNSPVNGWDRAYALAVDGAGNVYVTGYSAGSGTANDYATVKYDSDGEELWPAAARYNGPGNGDDQAMALAVDGSDNVYVTGYSAGSGTSYDYATVKYDGATGSQLREKRYNNSPVNDIDEAHALAVDGSGNVYVTGYSTRSGGDYDYATVKYDAGGVEKWVARYDGPTSNNDEARALAVDGLGNVYVTGYDGGSGADGGGTGRDYATVKYYTPPTTDHVAGQYNNAGWDPTDDGHAALDAQLDDPHGLYETGTGSTLYFADTGNNRIRVVNTEAQDIVVASVTIHPGDIETVAGGGSGCTEPCSATNQSLSGPRDVFVDKDGNIYIADTGNDRIRKVDAGGTITTVAGGGSCTPPDVGDGGPATSACLSSPSGVAVDEAGNIYIADTDNNRIRKVVAGGTITTVVGTGDAGYSGDGGPATAAHLNHPHDVYPYGSMYAGTIDLLIADTDNNVIRWVHGPSGIINTLAGNGEGSFGGDDGPAILAKLHAPEAVASDASLAVFVADTENDRIRRFAFGEAVITTFAGGGSGCDANHTEPYWGCPPTDAKLNQPKGVAPGSLIYSDSGSATLGEVDPYTGEPIGSFSNAAGCTSGMATIDWVFVLLTLGVILARRRIGAPLMRIQTGAGLSPRPKTKGRA